MRAETKMAERTVIVLGSTGSVGVQTLDVIREHPGEFRVVGLAAGGQHVDSLALQILEFKPLWVAVGGTGSVNAVRRAVNVRRSRDFVEPEYLDGPDGVVELAARPCGVVLNAITGSVGLPATLATLATGTTLALANKESLVVGGDLVRAAARPGQIVPVDSEHSALAQAMRSGRNEEVRRLIVTATGGPFRGRPLSELDDVTVEQALAHPKWSMGPVISINSATLANKGLEVIEAHLLFDLPYEDIKIMVHPQAFIHSMVEFHDGSTLAQVNPPDMRLPIALGLKWPDRIPNVVPGIDWSAAHTWELNPLDESQTPMVALARVVGLQGGAAPAVYNGANEACVEAFLSRKMPFTGIAQVVSQVVEEYRPEAGASSLEDLWAYDSWARARSRIIINARFG